MKKRNVTMVLVGGILVLVMALGVTAVFAQTDQDPETPPETEKELPFHQWNKHGFGFGERKERVRDHNELIAAELGVNVEDLRSAHAAAFEAAREDGILGFPGHRGFDKDGEFESYLADALAEIGVSIDDLKAAQEAVKDDIIAELVEQGVIPTPDEAPESRMNPRALMEQLEEKGITMQDVMEAMRQAYESAVNDAVSDDVINNDQAELILESDSRGLHSFGGMRGFGGTRRFNDSHGCPGDGGFRGFGPNADFNYENGNPAPTGVNF
jgi:hypothetical protein